MGQKLIEVPNLLLRPKTFDHVDDFQWLVSPHMFTSILTDGGTVAAGDAAGGIITFSPGTNDNDQCMLKTTNEIFLIAANKPIVGESLLKFVEAATNAANVFFGFADAIAADTIRDDGAGMKTSFSGAFIYKVDGSTVWKCVSSLGTDQTISTSTTTAGGTSYQKLRVEIHPVSSTVAEVTFFVDDVQLIDATSLKPIKHNLTYTGATEMNLGWGVKNGSGTQQTLLVDNVGWAGGR